MEKEKVLIDKDKLMNFVGSFEKVHNFPVPELKKILGKKTVFKVKGASLDDHIRANELASAVPILLSHMVDKLEKNEPIDNKSFTTMIDKKEIHNSTFFEINLFHKCVIDPKLTISEILELSEVMPELINNVVTF